MGRHSTKLVLNKCKKIENRNFHEKYESYKLFKNWKLIKIILIITNKIKIKNKQPACKCNQGSTICAILTSRMGEHGVSWEDMENIEDMAKMIQNTPIMVQSLYLWCKTLYLSTSWLKALNLWWRLKKSLHTRLENIILVQLKMGEHQTKRRALGLFWTEKL